MIYFVKHTNGLIKIGTSKRLSTRLKGLASEYGKGLQLLGVTDGSRNEEISIHKRFDHLRVEGEWFEPADDLLQFIAKETTVWSGTDDSGPDPYTPIRLDSRLATMVKMLAAYEGLAPKEYLSRLVRRPIGQAYIRMKKRLDRQASA